MWFDIFKIQQGTFSTLVPKNMPKIREDTPCRDRLNGIMVEMGNTIGKNEEVTMTSQDGSGFRELINTFNKNINTYPLFDRDKWDEVLPEPIHVKFTSGSNSQPNQFDKIPEDVCCEFLKFLEESKKYIKPMAGNSDPFRMEYKDWTFLGRVDIHNIVDLINVIITFDCFKTEDALNYNPEYDKIKIMFQLEYKESGIKWSGHMHYEDFFSEEEFYKLWMSREDRVINRRNEEEPNEWIYADWLKKKEVDMWFLNLDPMWWL